MIVLVLLISSSPCAGVCSTHNISSFQRFTMEEFQLLLFFLSFILPEAKITSHSFFSGLSPWKSIIHTMSSPR